MLLEEVAAGKPFVVPGLWMYEVANALLVLLRRKRIQPQQSLRARRGLSRLHPVIDDDGPRLALHRIWDLTAEYSLSIYDAAYLELAQREGLPLASKMRDSVEPRQNVASQSCSDDPAWVYISTLPSISISFTLNVTVR